MDYSNIYETIGNQSHDKQVDKVEKYIKGKISSEKNNLVLEEFYLMLLIILAQKQKVETKEMNEIYFEFIKLLKIEEKKLIMGYKSDKSFSSNLIIDVFYKTNIHNIVNLIKLYKGIGLEEKADMLIVIKNDLEKNLSLIQKNYKKYTKLTISKLLTNYGTSFWYLLAFTLISTVIFAFVYYVSDKTTQYPYVCGESCLTQEYQQPGIFNTKKIKGFEYYFYVSIGVMSNLGGEASQAGNMFLITIFSIEQILGLTLFGTTITLMGKKMDYQ